jgi:hypothetical protein
MAIVTLIKTTDAHFAAAAAPANPPSVAVLYKLGFRETRQTIQRANESLSLWAKAPAAAEHLAQSGTRWYIQI